MFAGAPDRGLEHETSAGARAALNRSATWAAVEYKKQISGHLFFNFFCSLSSFHSVMRSCFPLPILDNSVETTTTVLLLLCCVLFLVFLYLFLIQREF